MLLLSRLLLFLALAIAPAAQAADGRITVFGAASLTDVLQQAGASFSQETGGEVVFSFAASSTLARQIEAGAPADMVALASLDWADYLDGRGLIRHETRISPVGNSLVIAAPADSAVTLSTPPSAAELLTALGPGGRLAIGDPAHVPAGIYARQALDSLGLWDTLEPHLAYADNVRAALALIAHAEAPLGIVYATDLRSAPSVRLVERLPETSHPPITYAFAAVTGGKENAARGFLAFLASPSGLAIFARNGFTVR